MRSRGQNVFSSGKTCNDLEFEVKEIFSDHLKNRQYGHAELVSASI
jgi:hypothetical protein